MSHDAREHGRTTAPGWHDDPFSREGQRWWDGAQWTGRTRAARGAPRIRPIRRGSHVGRRAPGGPSLPPTLISRLGRLPPHALVVVGLLATFLLVGLLAPSAEESGVGAHGSRRAAYWACVDLVDRQLPTNVTAEFGGDSSATVRQSGRSWQVAATVTLETGDGEVGRAWDCTVVHDEGTWRGAATLE